MTLDEAIKHCLEEAGELQKRADSAELIDILDGLDVESCKECAAEHRQLAEWLRELKEAKRLLKAAVEDFKEINSDILTCKYCKWYSAENDECTFFPDDTPCEKICGWKHEGEALALIGEENTE